MTSAQILAFRTPAEPAIADEFETLWTLTQALSSVTTSDGLKSALTGPLAQRLGLGEVAVLRWRDGHLQPAAGPADAAQRLDRYAWTKLTMAETVVGMLGFPHRARVRHSQRLDAAVRMLLTTTARNVLTIETLQRTAVIDGLTGCFNRSHAMHVLESELRRAARTGLPVSVLIIDIDEFKSINDRYGHVPGDAVLTAVSAQLASMLRQSDVRCRMGGDEFLVILPDTSLEDARGVAEAVRQAMATLVIPSARGTIRVTGSIGVAADPGGAPADATAVIDRADVALYRAKQSGRNSVDVCLSSQVRVRQASVRRAAKLA